MTRLDWGAVGERFYETGVDRGVLYIDGNGVAWNGLVSVNETPTGGEAKPYYLDGVKFQNRSSNEEFEATIEAYTYPEEFASCDGTAYLGGGLYATQQRRKSFGFSYRSRVGNDVDGVDHAYKIHLVYNALAAPSELPHSTITDTLEPFNFSWHVTTRATISPYARPTSHFVIDSRTTPPDVLSGIEDLLYGKDSWAPRLPSLEELIYWLISKPDSIYDAGLPDSPYYETFDGGLPSDTNPSPILDGGTP